jgi:hypothetical protein
LELFDPYYNLGLSYFPLYLCDKETKSGVLYSCLFKNCVDGLTCVVHVCNYNQPLDTTFQSNQFLTLEQVNQPLVGDSSLFGFEVMRGRENLPG